MSGNVTPAIDSRQQSAISSKSYQLVSSFFMCTLIAFVIVGNSLAIATYCKAVRFRVVSRCFIVNLAVTDLLVGTLVMPIWLHYILRVDNHSSASLYNVWVTLDITCSTASICSLAIVSLDRYIIIRAPLSYDRLLSKPRAGILIFLIWFYALVIALLRGLRWGHYTLLVTGVSFVVPLSIMLFAYVNIFKAAKDQAHRIRLSSLANARGTRMSKMRFDIELKATKMISIVIGAFLLCWVPFYLATILSKYCPEMCNVSFELVIIVKWLHYANSAVNPVIYAMHNRDFRAVLRAIIWCGESNGHALKSTYENSLQRTTGKSTSRLVGRTVTRV